jgi:hypothetical protein
VLSLKVGSSTSADCPSPRAGSSTSSSGSSRGSSLAGSPTVGRSSSVGSLFGNNITSVGASATAESSSIGTAPPTRSISCNAGILRGAGSSGGGLLVSGKIGVNCIVGLLQKAQGLICVYQVCAFLQRCCWWECDTMCAIVCLAGLPW